MAGVEIVPIRSGTDADPSHRPKDDAWKAVANPWIYLEKLAVQWLTARNVPMRADLTYRLDRLPQGYVLFERPRPSNPKLIDRHLYGSPRHKFFDSPNRFWPHFENLMNTGSAQGCPCTICVPSSSKHLPLRPTGNKRKQSYSPPLISAAAFVRTAFKRNGESIVHMLTFSVAVKPPKLIPPKPRVQLAPDRIPDTLRNLMSKLEISGRLDEEFAEPHSMDWLAERQIIPNALRRMAEQPSFLPRRGETVLFVRHLDDGTEICREDSSDQFKVFDSKNNTFVGFPQWEAGIIAQEPTETVQIQDLLEESRKQANVTYSGFRVEPLPEPGSPDKSLSKRYRYVPLHHVRPFVFWRKLLNGIPVEDRHASIEHALRTMASWNMVENFRFKGAWPHASLHCKGLYVGSEVFVVGDAIRLIPRRGSMPDGAVTDVLAITSFQLELDASEQSIDPLDDIAEQSATPIKSTMFVYGKVFTTVPSLACKDYPHPLPKSEVAKLPKGMSGFTWYRRYHPGKSCRINLLQLVGRCFEAESMLLWFPPRAGSEDNTFRDVSSLLSTGLSDMRRARKYASAHDTRIPLGQKFFWGNSRGECLDIHELNGVLLSSNDPDRDSEKLDEWAGAARTLLNAAHAQHGKPVAKHLGPGSAQSPQPSEHSSNSTAAGHAPQSRAVSSARTTNAPSPAARIYGGIDDEDEEDDMTARFGLHGPGSRKRSVSVVGACGSGSAPDKTDGETSDDGVKGVATKDNGIRDSTMKRARIGG